MGFLAIVFPLAVGFVIVAAKAPRSNAAAIPIGYAIQPAKLPHSAEIVHVGIEPLQIDSISLADGTFQASFYIWWRWHGHTDPCPATIVNNASSQASSNYATRYEFTNSHGTEIPQPLGNGTFYQAAQVTVGVANAFSVNRFPLDNQTLQIHIESQYAYNELVFVPDTGYMSPHPDFEVSGWQVDGTSVQPFVHHYGTNFGQVAITDAFSALDYEIQVSRPFTHFLTKLFLPMFIILLAGISSLFVKTDDFDVRLAMAGTALLTLIFLQLGYGGELPPTAPVVVMDEIYALAYAAVGTTFMRVVYTTARAHQEADAKSFEKADHLIAILLGVGFLLGSTLLVLL